MEAHLHTACRGGAPPLDSPCSTGACKVGLGEILRPLPKGGALWTPAARSSTRRGAPRGYPLPPFPPNLPSYECSEAIWGGGGAQYSRFGEYCLNGGSDHPPSPLPRRKGEKIRSLGDTPRPLPKGGALWTPALRTEEGRRRLGDTPRPLPKGGALWTPALRTEEGRRRLGDTPRPLPKGGALWTPALRTEEGRRRLGDTPRPLPKGGALWTPALHVCAGGGRRAVW